MEDLHTGCQKTESGIRFLGGLWVLNAHVYMQGHFFPFNFSNTINLA